MSRAGGGGEYGVIANDTTNSDAEIMELDAIVTEKSKKKQQELEKQRQLEKKEDVDDYRDAYYYAHFICRKSGTVILKHGGDGAIQEHKEKCPWCIERREQKEAEKQARLDGFAKMRYILHMIERKKEEIEELKRKIAKEKKEKLLNWEIACKMIEYDIRSAKHTIEREQNIELPKLLNDENEITRKAAQEMYDEYLKKKMSEKEEDRRLGKY
jgi:hypothetical protein